VIPDSLGEMSSLVELSLRQCQLTCLPDSIGQLTHLTELDLRANRLTTLPESLVRLPNLVKLDLRWNPFTELPGCVADLQARGCLVYFCKRGVVWFTGRSGSRRM